MLAHILLLVFPRVLAGLKLVGHEYGESLATHALSRIKVAADRRHDMTEHTDAAREPGMRTANGHRTTGPPGGDRRLAAGAAALPARHHRAGNPDGAPRPAAPGHQAGAAGVALCGALLLPNLVETVARGQSLPCTLCMINYRDAGPPPTPAVVPLGEGISGETDPLVAAVCYQAWGWPVTLRGHQVWLTPQPDTVALIIPVLLAAQVSGILNQRRRRPPTLIHPEAPEHWVMLAGEHPHGALPWPRCVHQSTGALPLPPP